MAKRMDFEKETKRGTIRQRGFEAVEPDDTTLARGGFFRSSDAGGADERYHGPEPTSELRKARKRAKVRGVPVAVSEEPGGQVSGRPTQVKTATKRSSPKASREKKAPRSEAKISFRVPPPARTLSELPGVVQQSMPGGKVRSVIVKAKPLPAFARNRGAKK